MKRTSIHAWLLLPLFLLSSALNAQSVLDYVDVFIGTAGDHGQLDPSATVPNGLIKLGPDTHPSNHSGYDYNAKKIKGFSHNRIGGVGCSGAGGNLRILPGLGNPKKNSGQINKKTERAEPAYYSIQLSNGIKAELTATNYTGVHRYTFPKSDSAFLWVDLASSFARFEAAEYQPINSQEFSAKISARTVCDMGQYTVYFHIWSSHPLNQSKLENNQLLFRLKSHRHEEVLLHVTASTISAEDARTTWQMQQEKLDFDEVKAAGQSAWNQLLSKIEVDGKREYKKLFYTHLYHVYLNPVLSANPQGAYRGTDGQLYQDSTFQRYDSWSMWDNFRNKFSLMALLTPELSRHMAYSLMDLYKQGKHPWASPTEPVPTVRTEHTLITLLDLYQRGIQFDFADVFPAMLHEVHNIPAPTPDTQLEKSYDYWALAELARILNYDSLHNQLLDSAMNYKKTWHKHFATMGPNADIMHAEGLYEGTLWQYRWHVQFDIPELITLMGGAEKFTQELSHFFDNRLYNHGNQPDLHVPFLFNYGSSPWLTQKWVNEILTKETIQQYGTHKKWKKPYIGRIYKAEPAGYIPEMDDDDGTMSAWYVLAAMGLYPVEVGKPEFQINAPIFDEITIHLPHGKQFIISTKHQNARNYYIQKAQLNGQDYNQTSIQHSDILQGGTLQFYLNDEPNKDWGVQK